MRNLTSGGGPAATSGDTAPAWLARREALAAAAALTVALASSAPGPAWAAGDAAAAIGTLRAGAGVIMLRHAATVPGVGDPPGFRLQDCATQRNLSDSGRREAQALGAWLAAEGVEFAEVLSSRWCRCLDTARIAFGRAQGWPPLDSFFDDRAAEPARTAAVRERIAAWRGPGTLVLVTHMVNIAALAGDNVSAGEAVVLRPAPGTEAGFVRVGRLRVAAPQR